MEYYHLALGYFEYCICYMVIDTTAHLVKGTLDAR